MKKTKAKKISIIFIILFLIMSISIILYASGTISDPTNIVFEDKILCEKVTAALKYDKKITVEIVDDLTITVSEKDLESITELTLQGIRGSQISNLKGIQSFTNLEELNLPGNVVTTMSPACELTKLKKLNLTGNPVNEEMLTAIKNIPSILELNMTNTQLKDVSSFSTLTNLQTLILSNNNISNFEPISALSNITKLDISINASFTSLAQITSLTGLKELNISNTGILTLAGIEDIITLEKLYAANNVGLTDTSGIEALYQKDSTTKEVYLKNLKVLDLSSSGIVETKDQEGNVIQKANQPKISFSANAFSSLITLEELHLEYMGISSLSGLANLENLQHIDLANNKIQSNALEDFVKENNDGTIATENTLKATKIELQNNNIIDVSVFSQYPADIKYLDLRENHIYDTSSLKGHSFSEKLYLQNQTIIFGVYEKKIEINHYIILPEIMQQSQVENSIVYTENDLELTGITLNPDYTNPTEYNVIIDSGKSKSDEITVKINGGNADGSILTFQIGSKNGAHIDYLIESLMFNDENLYDEIYKEITTNTKYQKLIKDSLKVLPKRIININRAVIDNMNLLSFQNKSITDLTGLENCSELVTLYLQDNNIQTISQLEACTKIQTLNLANNPNIKDNNSAIEKMSNLYDLDLSNTGMTKIDSINNLTNSVKTLRMTVLNISNNGLEDIEGIEKITTLQKLYLANGNLDNEDMSAFSTLTGLTTLNISGNQISDISVLTNLTNIKYLYLNKNKIESIDAIKGKVFIELEFSENKVKDITPLSAHNSINNLIMDSNEIDDVSVLDNILIGDQQTLSVAGQKITRILGEDESGEVYVELPQIFKAAKQVGNKVYTSTDLIQTNCKIDDTGEHVIVDVDQVGLTAAQISIYGGTAHGTTLTIPIPIKANIEYSVLSETPTNQNVIATISFNRAGVKINNNDGKNTYTFTQNGEFTFEYTDEYGIKGTATAVVNNIDKDAPTITGVEDGKVYKKSVTPIIQDKNLKVVTLTKDGVNVEDYLSGDTIEEIGKYVLTAVDVVDNTKTVSFEIQEPSDKITAKNDVIKVTEEKNLIRGIEPKTTVQKIKESLESEMTYKILDKNGQSVSDNSRIGTGCQIKMANGKTYTIIVWGDLTGDGEISIAELARISRIASTSSANPSELEMLAIDVSQDNSIKVNDLAAISRMKNQN